MTFAEDLRAALGDRALPGDQSCWHTDFLPTGIACVDRALGGGRPGGFGYGRLVELFGNWSSGKTMLLYYALANNQRLGGRSVLFESEGAYLPDFFAACGGDPKELLVYHVSTVEQVFDGMKGVCLLMQKIKKKGDLTPVAIGWDSIAGTGTKHLQEVGMGTRDMTKAFQMSIGTQLITDLVYECRVAIIATNQIRERIGEQSTEPHTPGGRAWPFHSSQRVQLMFDGGWKGSLIQTEEGATVGRWTKGDVLKNKLAAPFTKFELPLYVIDDAPHPTFADAKTKVGIDIEEALFYYIYNQHKIGEDSAMTLHGGGRYSLHPILDSEQKSFYKKDWLSVLETHPHLRTVAYDDDQPSTDELANGVDSGTDE